MGLLATTPPSPPPPPNPSKGNQFLSGHLPVPRVRGMEVQLRSNSTFNWPKFKVPKGFIHTLLKLFSFLGEWENGEHEKWNDPKTV